MVRHASLILPGLVATALVAPALAQNIDKDANPRALDPGRVYFVAWQEVQAAEKFANAGHFKESQQRLLEAKRLFDLIAEFHPNFRPGLVKRRQNKTAEAMLKLRKAVARQEEEERKKLAGLIEEAPGSPQQAVRGQKASSEASVRAQNGDVLRGLERQIADLEKQRDQARREAAIARVQLEKANPVKSRFDEMNRDLLRLQIERRAMEKALQKARDSKEELDAEFLRAQASVDQQAKRLEQLKEAHRLEKQTANELIERQMERIESLEKELQLSQQRAASRELKIAQLQKRLDETGLLLKEVTMERDSLKRERDQLASMLELNNGNQIRKLIDEKVKLLAQLSRAQERIKNYQAEQETDDLELRESRTEIVLLKKRLLQIQEENASYSRQISELRDRLRGAEKRLAEVESQPKIDPEQAAEADMLRQVVSKMRRASLAREKGVERMIAAAEKLQLQNPEFQHALAALKGEPIQLSEEEQALLAEEAQETVRVVGAEIFAPVRGNRKTRLQKLRELREDVEAHLRLARRAYQRGEYSIAAEFFETVLEELHPDHFETLCNLGVVRLRLGQPSVASEHFQIASYQQSDHPFPQIMKGIACYQQGADEEAREALERGIELDPANINAHVVLASVVQRQGHSEEAIHALEKALQLKPNHPTALFNLARLEAELGKFAEAKRHYDLAIEHGALPDEAFAEELKGASQKKES